jgi:serine/threonine protein kinase
MARRMVALKFLPASLQNDAAALAGLHAEVRNARQVSHPNVCRVYDIGEVYGQHFLTMEYIDGEDLASLLRVNQDVEGVIDNSRFRGANRVRLRGFLVKRYV